jgi:hypothetical protein
VSLTAYTAGLTAQKIVAQCEALSHYPGLHLDAGTEAITAPAYVALNEILTSLYTRHDWPFLATAANVTISARENALPVDYWRQRFVDPLILIDGDQRKTLALMSPDDFFHQGLSSVSATGTPTRYTIDKNRSSFFVDCTPSQSFNAELHYYKLPTRLTAKEQVPMFPDSSMLVQLLSAWYYQQQDDSRYQQAKLEAAEAVMQVKASLYEDSDGADSLLDPRRFRTPNYDSWS